MKLTDLRLVLALSFIAVASMACIKNTDDTGDTSTEADADTDADSDSDSDADSDSDTDTGLLYFGWRGSWTVNGGSELDGTFGYWYYYGLTGEYLCGWDAGQTGTEPLTECADCDWAWKTEWDIGTTTEGDCTAFGFTDGESGKDVFGVNYNEWAMGFNSAYILEGYESYGEMEAIFLGLDGEWFPFAVYSSVSYDGQTLAFERQSQYSPYYY